MPKGPHAIISGITKNVITKNVMDFATKNVITNFVMSEIVSNFVKIL